MGDFSNCFELKLPENLDYQNIIYTRTAANIGDLVLLKKMRQQNPPFAWNEMTCAAASMNGHLEILQWAIKNGCPCDAYTYMYAAKNGHLRILDWIIRHKPECTDVLLSFIYQIAANNGQQHVLQWVVKQYYASY
jgi:hypothetical protein